MQIDVVAMNWGSREILLGECKWNKSKTGRQVVRDLVGRKTDNLRRDLAVNEDEWRVHYAIFCRSGLSPAANEDFKAAEGLVIDLETLDKDLSSN